MNKQQDREIAMFGCTAATLDADVKDARNRAGLRHTWDHDPTVQLVLSLLSDAQELTSMGAVDGRPEYARDAEELMNRVKYIADHYLTGS